MTDSMTAQSDLARHFMHPNNENLFSRKLRIGNNIMKYACK